MNATLASQLAYKTWAGAELFAAMAQLPDADHHPMLRVLNHIWTVDRIFIAHLRGEPHGFDATNTPDTPTLQTLREGQAACDAWLSEQLPHWSQAQLAESLRFRFTDGDEGCMTRAEIVQHLVLHGAYHRGAVGQMLRQAGIAPPRDLYTRHLHQSEPARRAANA